MRKEKMMADMEKWSRIASKNKTLEHMVWLSFFVFLIMQHRYVWMYIDDYGYASLNYAVSIGTMGNDYSLKDIIGYLYLHYTQWGGRVFYYAIAILIYHYFGLWGMRIIQSIILFFIFYLMYFMVRKANNYKMATEYPCVGAIMVCLLYGVFSVGLVNQGLYWFSASSAYVWSIAVLLLAVCHTEKLIARNDRKTYKWVLSGLIWFAAGFSQEQIAIATVVFAVGLGVYRRDYIKNIVIVIWFSIMGAAVMLCAPGNWKRAAVSDTNLPGLLKRNIPILFSFVLSDSMKLFVLIVTFAFSIVAVKMVSLGKKSFFFYGYAAVSWITFCGLLVTNKPIEENGYGFKILILTVISVGFLFTGYLFLKKHIYLAISMIAGILCYGAMACVPAVPVRVTIPFIF